MGRGPVLSRLPEGGVHRPAVTELHVWVGLGCPFPSGPQLLLHPSGSRGPLIRRDGARAGLRNGRVRTWPPTEEV